MNTLETIATTTGFTKAATSDIIDAIEESIAVGGTLDDIDSDLAAAIEALSERPGAQEWLTDHGLA